MLSVFFTVCFVLGLTFFRNFAPMKSLRFISSVLAFLAVVFVHGLLDNIAQTGLVAETPTEDCLNVPCDYRDINFETPCPMPSQISNTQSLNLPVRHLRNTQRQSNANGTRHQGSGHNASCSSGRATTALQPTAQKTTNFPSPYRFSDNHIYANCNLRL